MLECGKTVSLVMPARNEADAIPRLLESVSPRFDEIVIVSNCSTDDTVEVVKAAAVSDPRIRVYVDNRSRDGIGYGYACRSALSAATCDYVVECDCDGTYPFNDAVMDGGIVDRMFEGGYCFVTCSRYPDKNIPAFLRFGVSVLTCEMRLLYGMPVTDALSGMIVAERDAWQEIRKKVNCGDWNFSPQVKIVAWQEFGDKYREMKIIQQDRLGDETKQSYWKTGFGHLAWIASNRMPGGKDRRA